MDRHMYSFISILLIMNDYFFIIPQGKSKGVCKSGYVNFRFKTLRLISCGLPNLTFNIFSKQ